MVSMSQEKAWKEQTLSHLLLDQQLLGSIASHSHGDHKQAKWYLKTVGKTHVRESTVSLNKLLIECVRTRILTHRHEINMGLTLIKGTCEDEALLGLSTALFMDTEPLREGLAAHPKHGGGHGVGWGLANYGWTTSWLCTARELRMVSMLFNDFFKKSKDEQYFMTCGHYMKCDLSCTSGKLYLNTATLMCLLIICGCFLLQQQN